MTGSIDAALTSWRDLLGERFVITSLEEREAAATATFPTESQVPAILYPSDHLQVQACLRIANQFEIAIYPISGGRNWGLGSRVPAADSILLDLSRLDRIVEYDERLGFLVLEPGVTFQQAADFLLEKNSPFFLPVTGGSPRGSVIGNIAERGEGVGPYGQRVDFATNLRAVLPNGDCVHTGFGRFDAASVKHLHPHGVGVSLDGLLTQSNLGVITQLTVWLTPRPQVLRPFVGRISQRENLPLAVDAARELLLHRIVEANCVGIWNSYKINATLGAYPWEAMENQTPMDPVRFPSEPWVIGGAIYAASDEIAATTGRFIEQKLSPHCDDWQWCDASDPDNAYLGVPSEQNVRCAYWRKKSGLPSEIDPDADRCGLIWICFAIPLLGEEVRRSLDLVEPLIRRHGFEPNVGFNCVSGRCAHLYISLIYDRDVVGEDARAVACHDEVVARLQAEGHLPYRLGLLSMSSLPNPDDDYTKCLQAIKRTLDPRSILAPGRYDLR